MPLKLSARWLLLALLLGLQACSPPATPHWSGYVEGEYLQIAAPVSARLQHLPVQSGQTVQAGDELFALEAELEQAQRAEAEARLAMAEAQQSNLSRGRRAPELAVLQAQREQVKAQWQLAERALARTEQQAAQGFVSTARVDEARTQAQQAQARLNELEAAMAVAQLPARTDERQASQANTLAAEQVLRQARWREAQSRHLAPVAAEVAEVYFHVGERVMAGQPVLALLPPNQRVARFFVPETDIASLQLGQTVWVGCDGCGAPLPARISRVSTQPEFAPPVIYSNTSRSRLVFMVEARPDAAHALRLRPGQPLFVQRQP